ncbi:MAG TPA: hypothetical protein VKU38_06310 [Ktedonobacteraceae bacterium]|nr:hypothetical protein [Ktedonobacteraceae bacterium]
MKPTDIATAITQALVQGGAQWLVSTIVAFLPVLWTMALILHLGRPYVLRTLRRCGLRLGADVWWMSYLLMRDGVMLITFALSWIFFEPNIVVNSALPLTGPLAALALLLALAVKLSRRVDDDVNAYRLATVFLVVGATLYYGPQVFAVEATSQGYLSGFGQIFTSNQNQAVALGIMWVALAGALIVAGWLFVRTMMVANRTMARRMATTTAQKVPEQAAGI